jgi:hypothetical protein
MNFRPTPGRAGIYKVKTELQKALAKIAPSVSIQTIWEHDCDLRDIRKDCDGFDDENPEDWQAWQSEVKATAIVNGEEISGSDYLGGTWEKAGDHPAESNPEISGYEAQMTEEALEILLSRFSPVRHRELASEIERAIAHCQGAMADAYNAAQNAA